METHVEEFEFVREMRLRKEGEGGVFWHTPEVLAVFDAETAQKVNARNFADLTLPDKLHDVVRGRSGDPVSWKQVRAGWMARMRPLSEPARIADLYAGMSRLLEERRDRPIDLVRAVQDVCTRSLLPTVVSGLSPRDQARVFRDQDHKLDRLLTFAPQRDSFVGELRSIWIQVSAGSVVRRELRGRASGRRPRQMDLADPIVDQIPELGIDRAVDAVTAVLTAIAGPPGAVASCLVFELCRRPDWRERITAELAPLPPEDLGNPRLAPIALRFVKEVLRVWAAPLFLTRPVRADIEVDDVCLHKGQRYFVSPYLIHHDPKVWREADSFDPDRWLPDSPHGPCAHAGYVPFGWSPTSCVGATLGTTQLLLLAHLLCTRFRVEVPEPEKVVMNLAAIAYPRDFVGTIVRR